MPTATLPKPAVRPCEGCASTDAVGPFVMDGIVDGASGDYYWQVCRGCGRSTYCGPAVPAKVRFVKQYTNFSGRTFRRYAIVGKPETISYIHDVKVRNGRGEVHSLTNAEAKAEALARLATGVYVP